MPLPRLDTSAYHFDPTVAPLHDEGHWRMFPLFSGKTPRLRAVSAHISWLIPGRSAHPAHRHPGEELCLVLEGDLELGLPTGGVRLPVPRGQTAYISAEMAHSLTSTGSVAALYMIVRWLSDPPPSTPTPAAPTILDTAAPGEALRRRVLEAPTNYLQSLRCEMVSLPSGEEAVLEAPVDRLLVVVEGRVEIREASAEAIGCVFAEADERHTLRAGEAGAAYLEIAFERYPASSARRVANAVLWYSRRTVLRGPAAEL